MTLPAKKGVNTVRNFWISIFVLFLIVVVLGSLYGSVALMAPSTFWQRLVAYAIGTFVASFAGMAYTMITVILCKDDID
jgi:hypothetical protein